MPNEFPRGPIITFGSPHSKRMRDWVRSFPFGADPHDSILQARLERNAEMQIGYAAGLKDLKERLDALTISMLNGGSGFPMACTLRDYFREYFGRFSTFGIGSMPTSFNVAEAFFRISNPLFDFVLREEHDHLLRLYEFFSWFTESGSVTNDPSALKDVMREGEIYSYEMTGSPDDFRLGTHNSETAILGISLVRHKNELSAILLAGEKPPYPSNEEVGGIAFEGTPWKGKEGINPDPNLQFADRLLPGLPGFGRVILLTRIDLSARSYDVRYVNIDVGNGFLVHTDDRCVLEHVDSKVAENSARHLDRYADLFSSVAALIYLPMFFVVRQADVTKETFATDLGAQRNKTAFRKAIKVLGVASVALQRSVNCLRCDIPPLESGDQVVKTSEFNSRSDGHWRELGPTEIGADAEGQAIVGRTWVSTYESWSSWQPSDFVVRRKARNRDGPDPGTIYVMRSEAHSNQLFKVGLSRRDPRTRADELTGATGVPLPFSVLADWAVTDCATIEKLAHDRLSPYRVNKKREFFRAPISTIISVIEDIIAQTENE